MALEVAMVPGKQHPGAPAAGKGQGAAGTRSELLPAPARLSADNQLLQLALISVSSSLWELTCVQLAQHSSCAQLARD